MEAVNKWEEIKLVSELSKEVFPAQYGDVMLNYNPSIGEAEARQPTVEASLGSVVN